MKDKMTWEETIQYIRTKPEYKYLVEKAYFEENLPLNVERFIKSEEFLETLAILKKYQPVATSILDIGAGNGISSIALALSGYEVSVVEPDKSETIGAGAIRKLKEHYQLSNVEIFEAFAEEIQFPDEHFDIVYARQCMHHAYHLEKFVAEASRVLKKGGLFITVRDHVVFDEADKQWFLESHPLHKYYGGENAFSPTEYKSAMQKAGLEVVQEIKHFDSVINYFPSTKDEIENYQSIQIKLREAHLVRKIGFLGKISFLKKLYHLYLDKKVGKILPLDEKNVAGRMYSYLCIKK
jgi:ubiquinone/menaquinone biosynthesis C-methylase UbiE